MAQVKQFERFSEEKLDSLRARYRGDALFRTWVRTLCQLESQLGELNAVEVWSETERIRQQLSEITEYRDTEVEFLYEKLKRRHGSERTAIVILTVLFTQLCDAAPDMDDDSTERNPNKAECTALAHILMSPSHRDFPIKLLSAFQSHRNDNNGNKIVLPVTDYMNVNSPLELMTEDAKNQIDTWVRDITRQTIGVKGLLSVSWETYENIWREICAIQNIIPMLQRKEPNSCKNSWGKNLKLVANVLGIMKGTPCGEKMMLEGSDNAISDAVGINVRTYIANHSDFGTNNTALNKELHRMIKQRIASIIGKT